MKSNEFDKALVALERSVPADLAETASEIFWAACLIGVDQRLVKAVAALVKRPDMSTGQLMKAAGVTSGTATRARTGLRIVGREQLPPAPPKVEPEPVAAETQGPEALGPDPAPTGPVDPADFFPCNVTAAEAVEPDPAPTAPQMPGRANGHQQPPQPAPAKVPKRDRPGKPGGIKERAKALLLAELEAGPQDEAWIMEAAAAEQVSPGALMRAAERLGVRVQRGQWRLPG